MYSGPKPALKSKHELEMKEDPRPALIALVGILVGAIAQLHQH
jgi:hypothetical protein